MSDTPLNMPEFIKQSEAYYKEIKDTLETTNKGQYAALDFQGKQYWIGSSASEALTLAKAAFPNKLFYLIQVGSSSAFSIQSVSRGDDFDISHEYNWSY